jgi:histone arginine demethylase JMJD6
MKPVVSPQFRVDAIERRRGTDLSPRIFTHGETGQPRPLVVLGAIDHWPALGKWTPEFFKQSQGSLQVTVDGQLWSLGELMDRVLASTPDRPAPYLRNQLISQWPPELAADITPMPACTRPNFLDSKLFPSRSPLTYVEAYIGGAGAKFPVLHFDNLHTHAFLMQVYGKKEYLVLPPDQTEFLYPLADIPNKSSIPDIERVDPAKFPLCARAQGVRFELHPGETLFVPAGWWHTARILSPSITVSINAANDANWHDFSRDFAATVAARSRLKAALLAPYLIALGELLSIFGE